MNDLQILIYVIGSVWVGISMANVILAIWKTKLEAKKQSENSACIYALYKELERYNNNTFGEIKNDAKK